MGVRAPFLKKNVNFNELIVISVEKNASDRGVAMRFKNVVPTGPL